MESQPKIPDRPKFKGVLPFFLSYLLIGIASMASVALGIVAALGTLYWFKMKRNAGATQIAIILLLAVVGIGMGRIAANPAHPSQTAGKTSEPSAPAQSSASPTVSPEEAAIKKTQALAIVTDTTSQYANWVSEGKQALGTTPYPDGMTALAALNDPTSAASKWRAVNSQITKSSYVIDGPVLHSLQALYPNGTVPDSITSWNYDMGALLGVDLKVWSDKATSWQDSEISSSELAPYTEKVDNDLATVQSDVAAIAKDR